MKMNVGCLDRIIRVILGTLLLTSFYFLGNNWLLIGIIPLLTGIFGYCPIYQILGTSTK
ncbi:DUF2892 domain-containing protein [Candidatus Gracilibacteria bacterium]|nr:DUF2892 domain-containing protein [Candidatus Gracilibacteria bacterium]